MSLNPRQMMTTGEKEGRGRTGEGGCSDAEKEGAEKYHCGSYDGGGQERSCICTFNVDQPSLTFHQAFVLHRIPP